MIFVNAFALAIMASCLFATVLVLTRNLHGHLTLDNQAGVQKLHVVPTPRVGGLALMMGALAGGFALPDGGRELWWMICLAAIPAFASGLIEDVTKRVGVRTRLLATILSGLIFCLLSGYAIRGVDLPGVDMLLAIGPVAVLFTAFAIGGIANAVNIIDGVNGLASGTAIIILAGFGLIAWQTGDTAIMGVCLVAIGAIAGFFLLNYPLGLIFFGDAGAYGTGYLLAVLAVALPARNPEISPIIGILLLAYPMIETFVSIHRRTVRTGSHPGQPDRLHLHSLVYRSLARRIARGLGRPQLRNPVASTILWAFPLLSTVLAVFCAKSSLAIWGALLVVACCYLLLYRRVALLRGRGGNGPSGRNIRPHHPAAHPAE